MNPRIAPFVAAVFALAAVTACTSAVDDGVGTSSAAASAADKQIYVSMADQRARAFEGAFAVRQVEIGMASLLSLLFGLTISVFGLAMLRSRRLPHWLGWLGPLGGLATAAAGVAQAYTGFSPLAMDLSMRASGALLIWALVVGGKLWRLPPDATS